MASHWIKSHLKTLATLLLVSACTTPSTSVGMIDGKAAYQFEAFIGVGDIQGIKSVEEAIPRLEAKGSWFDKSAQQSCPSGYRIVKRGQHTVDRRVQPSQYGSYMITTVKRPITYVCL